MNVVKSDNKNDLGEEEVEELDPSVAALLMFGGDEAEHDLASHPDAEELD